MRDDTPMTSDMVNATASRTAVAKFAPQDGIVINAGEFESVLVASRADIPDQQIAKDEVVGSQGIGVGAAVVAIDPVAGGIRDLQVLDDDELGTHQLQCA